jgi:tetratricopeptide (TPR) repeat protein
LPWAALALSACGPSLGVADRGQSLRPGIDVREEAVDGLTVGHRLMGAGQFELALKAYLRAASEKGFTVDVLSALGSANLQLGRLGQAEDLLRRAIATDETFAPAWNNLGVVLMERGNTGEAERVFRTAFALDSGESAQIRNNLSLALAKIEDASYGIENNETFALIRRGGSAYSLRLSP